MLIVPTAVERVLSPGAGAGANPAAAAAVGRDAALLLSWLGRQLLTMQPVMPNIAAAVVLAGEI